MSEQQKILYAQWLAAWIAGDYEMQEIANNTLKATGLWAFENGRGLPNVRAWYSGRLLPGMQFVWQKGYPFEERSTITRITRQGEDVWVWTVSPGSGMEVYTDANLFRASAVAVEDYDYK